MGGYQDYERDVPYGWSGKKDATVWEVWVCVVAHPCVFDDDLACFTYNEMKGVFVPWGLNSVIRVVKK